MSGKNIIQKGVVELQWDKGGQGFSWQQEISDWCNEQLLPQLEKKLEHFATVKETIRINALHIDVQTEGNELNEQLAATIALMLEEKIRKDVGASLLQKIDTNENALECFLYFLQTGFLPWWSTITSVNDFQQLISSLSHHVDTDTNQKLKNVLQNVNAQERLLLQPHSLFQKVLSLLYNQTEKDVAESFEQVHKLLSVLKTNAEQKELLEVVKKGILKSSLGNDVNRYWKELANILFTQIATLPNESFILLLQEYKLSEWFLVKINTSLEDSPKESITEPVKRKEKPYSLIHIEKEKGEGIYIQNAGLVIVASYLPMFFKNLEVLVANEINNKALAIAVLQWLASGIDKYAEFDVVLPKIFCGIEPEQAVEVVTFLPDSFKQEANELLQSIIQHWSILKNTSVQGLQESFLQRKGKLTFMQSHWLLQVEQKSYDLLLEHLPVTISRIKLPWMKHLLITEWIN